jgi:uncharacterized protein
MDEAMGKIVPPYRKMISEYTTQEYWQRDDQVTDEQFRRIDIPALMTTGWFDADQSGSLIYWSGMRRLSPARDRQFLIVGPWNHGEAIFGHGPARIGEVERGADTNLDFPALAVRWFDYCLKDTAARFDAPRVRAYLSGDNKWLQFDEYPPADVRSRNLYLRSGGRANSLHGDGTLRWTAPAGEQPPDRYVFDPLHPVPGLSGRKGHGGHGVDQREVEQRDDVLVYTSEPLTEPLPIMGPVEVILYAASDAPDTDWTAKLVDVYPDGRAVKLGILAAGIIRARYRFGLDRETPLVPGKVEQYRIKLYDIGHVFQSGHRLRVEISSSAYPDFNPNQNTGQPVATDTQWRKARQTVFHDRARPSHIVLPLLPPEIWRRAESR